MESRGLQNVDAFYDQELYVFSFGWSDLAPEAMESATHGETLPVDEAAIIAQGAVADECMEQHYNAVSDAWQAVHEDEIERADQEYRALVIKCLREEGIGVDDLDPTTIDEVDAAHPGVRRQCSERAWDEVDARYGPAVSGPTGEGE